MHHRHALRGHGQRNITAPTIASGIVPASIPCHGHSFGRLMDTHESAPKIRIPGPKEEPVGVRTHDVMPDQGVGTELLQGAPVMKTAAPIPNPKR
jgi:hypothetical protein